jgi:phosphatidylglycerophosphate synthase
MTTPAVTFKPAERSHTSFLASAEKRALLWIAARLPAWVNSDHLTALGFAALVGAGAAYWRAGSNPYGLLVVIPLLALNWFGDSLDGTLARVRNRQRPRYGFYVDHILDAIGMFFLMSGLAFSGYMTPMVAFAFLIAYLLLSIEIYLTTYTIGTFHLYYWRFGTTELRILLIVGNLFALRRPYATLAGRDFLLFDIGFAFGTVALALILVHATVRHTVSLYREETRR